MSSSFSQRIAYLPTCDPEAANAAWMDWLCELGYTGIYLEPDPFRPPRSGNMSQFPTLYRLLSLYDFAWGEHRERLRAWVARTCDLAHARGLKVYLGLWEPRIPAEAWGLFPVAFHGRGGWDAPPWDSISWCLGHPPALAAFEEMATAAFAALPGIDGFKLGSHDNDACLCGAVCPRCAHLTRAQQMDTLFGTLVRAIDRAGRHRADLDYVVYVWWVADDEVDALARHLAGRRVTVLGRSTQGQTQYWRGRPLGTVFDLALGIPGLGDAFQQAAAKAHARGWQIADMTPFGHTIEYFWQPYTPAPHRVADILANLHAVGASGWFDYDCGGVYPGVNTEIVREDTRHPGLPAESLAAQTLARLYPAHELAAATAAYRLAEDALAARPIAFTPPDVSNLSGRNTIELAIALPFEPGDLSGLDQGHRIFWSAPTNFLTPGSLPTLLDMYAHAAAQWAAAAAALAPLQGQAHWCAILPWEKQVLRCHALAAASAHRYLQMAANHLARANGTLGAEAERARLHALLTDELADVRAYAALWRADPRLLDNTNIRLVPFLQACMRWLPIDPADPFATKLAHTQAQLARFAPGARLDAVPGWPSP